LVFRARYWPKVRLFLDHYFGVSDRAPEASLCEDGPEIFD
jgi:hypothetical protein